MRRITLETKMATLVRVLLGQGAAGKRQPLLYTRRPILLMYVCLSACAVGFGFAQAADADADGIPDAWETQYGMDPADPADAALDADGDGLSARQEYTFGTVPTNPDSDSDTVPDGVEAGCGMDPLAAALTAPDYAYDRWVFEDAQDGLTAGWDIYDTRVTGTISNVVDPDDPGNRAIRLAGDDFFTGYRFTFPAPDTVRFKLQWRLRFDSPYVIYVPCQTLLGARYLYYAPSTFAAYASGGYIRHGLGSGRGLGAWVVVRRDLARDVSSVEPGNRLISAGSVLIRGRGLVDDIRLYAYPDADRDLLPDAAEIVAGLNPSNPADAVGDADGDGVSNLDEIILTGTSPGRADTDADGLRDGEELFETGTDPLDPDPDADNLNDGDEVLLAGTDPFCADTDGDSLNDGTEWASGMDPLASALEGLGYLYDMTVLDDAQDGDTAGWSVYDNDPPGTIANMEDPTVPGNRVLAMDGHPLDTGYQFTFPQPETRRLKLQWRMQFASVYTVYVRCRTSLGSRYLRYGPNAAAPYLFGIYAMHGLGSGTGVGAWATVRRDLVADLHAVEPANELLAVDAVLFRGVGMVDDLALLAYPDADRDLLPDAVETALGLDPDDPADAQADVDGDGLGSLDELVLTGTDPGVADMDADGLSDGHEVRLSGTDPLNPDSDGDTVPDGLEVLSGMDPLVPALQGNGYRYETRVLEDAEDGNAVGWDVYDNDPPGMIANVEDETLPPNRIIGLNAGSGLTGFRFSLPGPESLWTLLEWRMKAAPGYIVYVSCTTAAGHRYLEYVPGSFTPYVVGEYVYLPLGTAAVGRWDTIRRDLAADLARVQPGNTLDSIDALLFRGVSFVDDIAVYAYVDADADVLPDSVESAAGLNPADPADALGDADADGLDNLAEFVLGTALTLSDTDGDGLPDGAERLTLGTDPLNPDSDGDTVPDGIEVLSGMDPLTPALEGDGFRYETVLLDDAEDGDTAGWDIYDDAEPGSIANVADPAAAGHRAVLLQGAEFNTGYRFTLDPPDTRRFRFQWRMNFSTPYVIYLNCLTSEGQCYLQYVPGSAAPYAGGDSYVVHCLPVGLGLGAWATVRRDLAADLQSVRPGAVLLEVSTFLVRGRGMIDDLALYAYPDGDRDLLPDGVETALGLDPADPADGAADSDYDLLSNADEFIYGTDPGAPDTDGDLLPDGGEILLGLDPFDPTDAAAAFVPAVTTPATEAGLAVAYYQGYFRNLPHFATIPHYGAGVLPVLDMAPTSGAVLGSGHSNFVAAVIQGWIVVPEDGWYTFHLTHDDGAVLSIDGRPVISADAYVSGAGPYAQSRGGLALRAGAHALRLEYFEFGDRAALLLEWARPGEPPALVPAAAFRHDPVLLAQTAIADDADRDGLTDAEELAAGSGVTSADSDGDGLSDGAEVHLYGTDPLATDTDGDGVTDRDETVLAHSDPLTVDFDGTFTDVASVEGRAATVVTGTWDLNSGGAVCRDRRGSLSFTLAVPSAGVFAIAVRGTQDNATTAQADFALDGWLDEAQLGRAVLHGPAGSTGVCRFFTPLLAAGDHTFRLDWRNGESDTFLRVVSVALQQVGGPDSDGDGTPDWFEHRLAGCTDSVATTVYTAVSPYCIEGTAPVRELVALRSSFVPDDTAYAVDASGRLICPVLAGTGSRWYADVPLSPDEATDLGLSWENGALTRERTAVWRPTNVLQTGSIALRVGDSLLLTGRPGDGNGGGRGNGSSSGNGSVLLEVEGEVYQTTPGQVVPYRFDHAGTVSVRATFAPQSAHPTVNVMTVTVVACAFNGRPALVVGYQRLWDNPGVPEEAALEWDAHLRVDEAYMEDGGRQLNLITYEDRNGRIVARLGEGGPILASTQVDALTYDTSAETRFAIVREFADGSQLIEGRITLGYVPPDLQVVMHIFAGGVMFEDGTVDRVFTAADFDETGELRFRFIRSEDGYTAACHYVRFFQNGFLIKTH